jgi:hypothetical protein
VIREEEYQPVAPLGSHPASGERGSAPQGNAHGCAGSHIPECPLSGCVGENDEGSGILLNKNYIMEE